MVVMRLADPEDRQRHQPAYWRELVSAAGRSWTAALRQEDSVTAMGADNLVRLTGCPTLEAVQVVQRLQRSTPTLLWSAGVACWNHRESEDELLARALDALERAEARPGSIALAECGP